MPYISPDRAQAIDDGEEPRMPGELNYAISMMVIKYLKQRKVENKGTLNHTILNSVHGTLIGVEAEYYRRVMEPYEDAKIVSNGDIYASLLEEMGLDGR